MTFRGCQCDKPDCPECGPLAALALEIRREFETTRGEARVPTAEIVWWRAQMRARQNAARKAARPILFTQALAVAALIGLLVSVIGRVTLPMISWGDLVPGIVAGLPVVQIAIAAAFCLVGAPVAVYLALSRE
jgi:hypothetical protein